MRTSLIIVISLAVAASGCSALTGSMTPEQQFKSQFNDFRTSDYHVTYEVEANIGGLGSIVSGAINKPEIYSRDGQSKFVVGVSGVTAAAYDIFENRSVVCTQGSIFGGVMGSGSETESKVSCEVLSSSSAVQEYEDDFEDVNISIEGTETVANRECTNYRIKPTEEVKDNLSDESIPGSSGISDYKDSKVNICLDNQKGYPALITVKSNETSELRSEGMKELLRIEATDYDMDFEGVNMEVPVNVGASISCDPFTVNISSFGYSGEVMYSVNGEENVTTQVEADETAKVNLANESRISGSNEVQVYTDGESTSASCYHYSYDFGTDYGTDYDYNYSY